MKSKICTMCKKRKKIEAYTVRKNWRGTGTVYRKAVCKKCSVILSQEYYRNNKKRVLQYQKKYHERKIRTANKTSI